MRSIRETRRGLTAKDFVRFGRAIHAPIRFLSAALLTGSLASCASVQPLKPGEALTETQRSDAIRRASVWTAIDTPSVDIKKGPEIQGAFEFDQWVDCVYKEKEMSGASAKFTCVVGPDRELKAKYGANNPEVFGEVLTSRLFWALGFAADAMFPVRVRCNGCSADPRHDPKRKAGTQYFPFAVIEMKLPGRAMEIHQDSGWDWSELDSIGPDAPKDARAHRDALKLLAAFVQHGDSRAGNQRLLCPAGEEDGPLGCRSPVMMVHDMGLTFGKATRLDKSKSAVDLEKWAGVSVWEDPTKCVADLKNSYFGRFHDPTISEAGRAFLADRLNQLSDTQLRDLFEAARVHHHELEPGVAPARKIDDWVKVFKTKRDQISAARCPDGEPTQTASGR